jgi:hypothetical protein
MNLDDDAKEAVRELGDAINSAIEKSPRVVDAIEHLREIGYEPNLMLKLEIGLEELAERFDDDGSEAGEIELDLTDEDLKTLRRMKIRLE